MRQVIEYPHSISKIEGQRKIVTNFMLCPKLIYQIKSALKSDFMRIALLKSKILPILSPHHFKTSLMRGCEVKWLQ